MNDRYAASRINLVKQEYEADFNKRKGSLFANQFHNALPEYNNEYNFDDTSTVIDLQLVIEIPKTKIPPLKMKSQSQKNIFNKGNQMKNETKSEREESIIAKDILSQNIPDFHKRFVIQEREEDKIYRKAYEEERNKKEETLKKVFVLEKKKNQERIFRKKEIDFKIYAFDSNGILFRKPIVPQFEDLNRALEEEKEYEKRKLEDKEKQFELERLKALNINKKKRKKDAEKEKEEEEEKEKQRKIDQIREKERRRIKEKSNFAPDFIIPKQDIKLNGVFENIIPIETIQFDSISQHKRLTKQTSMDCMIYNKTGNTIEKYFVKPKEIQKKKNELCGSHYDLINPVPGVVLYEKNKPEKFCSAFIDQYNRTSLHDYSKMLNESMLYNNSMVKRGIVSMPLQPKNSSIGGFEQQPYYGYKESIQTSKNPLIQSADTNTNQDMSKSPIDSLSKKELEKKQLPLISKPLKNCHSVEDINANFDPEKIRNVFNLPVNDLQPLNSQDLNSIPMYHNSFNKMMQNKIKPCENYFTKNKKIGNIYLQKHYNEHEEVNNFNKDIVKNKEEWGISFAQYSRQPPFTEFHKNLSHKGELEQTIIQAKLPRERRLNRVIHNI